MIRLEDVVVRFGSVQALTMDSLEIARGERLGVVGANGCGKSTLLRLLAGLLEPSQGRLEGRLPRGRAILVHQRPYLFRGSGRDNVAWALGLQGRPRQEADAWLERLGAGPFADRPARDLSGGERQRIALARALAVGPELLLLDEPFTALDEPGAAALREVLAEYDGTWVLAGPDVGPAPVSREVVLRTATRA